MYTYMRIITYVELLHYKAVACDEFVFVITQVITDTLVITIAFLHTYVYEYYSINCSICNRCKMVV